MYRRIPPVFRLEYLHVFLSIIADKGYDYETLREAIFDQRLTFEKEKFKAIGRGYRLKKEKVKSKHLIKNCYQLSIQTGFLRKADGDLFLSEDSQMFVELGIGNPKTKTMLLDKLLNTYLPFREALFCIRNQENGKILLPLRKEKGLFKSFAEKFQLGMNPIQFEVVRNLLTQFGVLNWRERRNGNRMQRVYLIVVVLKLSESLKSLNETSKFTSFTNFSVSQFIKEIAREENPSIEEMTKEQILEEARGKGYITIPLRDIGDFLFLKNLETDKGKLEEVLWNEYLKLSDYKSGYPVYYSQLRDNVCQELRISDKTFDNLIRRMINKPDEFEVKLHAGGGPLPPRRDLSSMLKALPPKTGSDEYITFIKANK